MEILNVDWLSNNEIYIYIYIIYNYCFGQSDVDLWYRMIGFFKFLVDITDIADVVCLLFLLFIIRFCFAFYNQTSDILFAIYFMAGNKPQKSFISSYLWKHVGSFFKKVFKEQYLFHIEKLRST